MMKKQIYSIHKILNKVERKLAQLTSSYIYRTKQITHARKLPVISEIGRCIVRELNREGVAVLHLRELPFSSNVSLLNAMEKAVKDLHEASPDSPRLTEYRTGFEHCIPINPTRIAMYYPELFLWGLDEQLLDIIENCIGLPPAYHGVILRKEIVDEQQVGSRIWHQDQDDRNIIRVSIYLNDVDEKGGAFEYIPRSLTPSIRTFKYGPNILDEHMEEVIPSSKWKTCTGPAGTVVFAAAAKIFHHGKMPSKERMAASFYYTSRNPSNEKLCREFSFQSGIPFIFQPLTKRQRECLWKYQELLPAQKADYLLPTNKLTVPVNESPSSFSTLRG
ncbi:hypothetical protein [Chlorogloeopsis sp. ULAP02]|uniref:hypothetical protein n=1 Tax=Chlorogloeopsis sp. ULAP02 TaxID=3107926 RepID=UPI00313646F4